MNPSLEDRRHTLDDSIEPPISAVRLWRTWSAYRVVIGSSLLAVAIVYTCFAILFYLAAPVERTTTLSFKLNFEGADVGRYPNGARFNPADIVNTWVLDDVFATNQLGRFTSGGNFARAISIVESNPQYDLAEAEYQARLADPRLSPNERERLVRDWETKRNSLSKGEYALSFVRTEAVRRIPETTARRALVDILRSWARVAASEHHVLEYPVSVLSPSHLTAAGDPRDLTVAAQLLRRRIRRVIANVRELEEIPGAGLIRSKRRRISLAEVRLHLDDLLRVRLDPLVRAIRAPGPGAREAAVRFLEAQLQYDQSELARHEMNIQVVRDALAMYSSQNRSLQPPAHAATPAPQEITPPSPETLMPQLGDTFIDRLADLTRASAGMAYREKLVDEYRRLARDLIPAQEEVTYDQQLLAQLRAGEPSNETTTQIAADVAAIRAEASALIAETNDIYASLSRGRSPVAELFTITAPPTSRAVRGRDPLTLVLYGVLILLVSLAIVLVAVLAAERLRRGAPHPVG